MKLADYAWMFVQSFNPNQYTTLLERPMRNFLMFITGVLLLCLTIFILLTIPLTLQYISSMPAKTAEIDRLNVHADVEADQAVTLLARPAVILDMQANTTRNGDIVLSKEGILYPQYLFFGTSLMPWAEVTDLKKQTHTRDRVLAAIVLFMLPSIIFWFFLYSILKAGVIFLLFLLLGYSIPLLFKHTIAFREVIKLALLTIPSLIIMDFAFYPLAPLFWWGLLIASSLFFVGIALLSEIKTRAHK